MNDTRYSAFISYSHRDERWASWLHRQLESYRVPRRLAEIAGVERLTPIFRDRDELPASSNLSDTIQDALSRSDALIVICSPAAVASRWVGEEIALYQRLEQGPVICMIVDGEPGGGEAECFPEPVRFEVDSSGERRAIEPLAADVRPHGDGRRTAKLKIAAALLGVGLNELVEREQRRRMRQLAVVSAGSLAGMALTTGLAVFALLAEQRANREAETATRVTEFMVEMFDVSDPDEAKGEVVSARAVLDSGAERIDRELDDEPLVRAELMMVIGRVYRTLGLFDEAAEFARRALAVFEERLGDGHLKVAEADLVLAAIQVERSEFEAALARRERARAIREEQLEPGDPLVIESRLRVAHSLQGLGRLDEALPIFRRAVEELEAQGTRRDLLTFALTGVASVNWAVGEFAEAEPALQRVLELRVAETAGEDNTLVSQTLANLGALKYMNEDYEGAKSDYERSLAMAERLLDREHPKLIITLYNLGEALLALDRIEEGLRHFRRSLDIARMLGEDDANTAWGRLGLALGGLAQGDDEEAVRQAQQAVEVRRGAYGDQHLLVAEALEVLARAREAAGSERDARAATEEAARIRAGLAQTAGDA